MRRSPIACNHISVPFVPRDVLMQVRDFRSRLKEECMIAKRCFIVAIPDY